MVMLNRFRMSLNGFNYTQFYNFHLSLPHMGILIHSSWKNPCSLAQKRSIILVTPSYPCIIVLPSFGIYIPISIFSSLSGRCFTQKSFEVFVLFTLDLKIYIWVQVVKMLTSLAFIVNFNKLLGTEADAWDVSNY